MDFDDRENLFFVLSHFRWTPVQFEKKGEAHLKLFSRVNKQIPSILVQSSQNRLHFFFLATRSRPIFFLIFFHLLFSSFGLFPIL